MLNFHANAARHLLAGGLHCRASVEQSNRVVWYLSAVPFVLFDDSMKAVNW